MQQKTARINVAYVIDDYTPGSGAENQLITLIDNLNLREFRPHVVNLRPHHPGRVYPTHCHLMFLGVEGRVWSPTGLAGIARLARFIRQKDIDIVQAYFVESRIVATVAARLARRGTLVFCKRNARREQTRLARALAAKSDYCLSNSRCGGDLVTKFEGFPPERIFTVYNGVRLPERIGTCLSRASLGIPDNAPVVTMVANYRKVKRIDRFLQAAARLDNRQAHFMVVGRGRRESELKTLSQELGISERVHFCHTVEGIRWILDMTDIGVLSSESEGLSNALIEYAMAGIPAVAFDVGGNSEVITHGLTGYLVRENDLAKMAGYLDKLLANEPLRQRLGRHAQRMARNKFAVRAMVEKTQAFYRHILNGQLANLQTEVSHFR